MAEIIHLRQARKRKKRADKAGQAAENRARHGRTKAESRRQAKELDSSEKTLDGKKLDPDTR
jgi:hypothetical protein